MPVMKTSTAVSFLLAFLSLTVAAPASASISISVDPGALFGYIPLDAFGGTLLTPIGDEQSVNFNIPNFEFAGATWNRVGVTSNGYLVVGGTSGAADVQFVGQNLPNSSDPNNVLAPFWTDLDGTGAPGILVNILTDGVSDWFVAEWRLNEFGTSNQFIFQAWIGLNGVEDITFTYDSMPTLTSSGLSSLTVGAENADGTAGDNYYHGGVGTVPGTGDSLRVTSTITPDPPNGAVPEPMSMLVWGGVMLLGGGASLRRWCDA